MYMYTVYVLMQGTKSMDNLKYMYVRSLFVEILAIYFISIHMGGGRGGGQKGRLQIVQSSRGVFTWGIYQKCAKW